jgi:hypothetical protein
MSDLKTPAEKLAWLRKYVDPNLPDIYNMADQGFVPNGCGPESWKLGSVEIPTNQKIKILGIPIDLRLVPNKFIGLPCIEVAGTQLHAEIVGALATALPGVTTDAEAMAEVSVA